MPEYWKRRIKARSRCKETSTFFRYRKVVIRGRDYDLRFALFNNNLPNRNTIIGIQPKNVQTLIEMADIDGATGGIDANGLHHHATRNIA